MKGRENTIRVQHVRHEIQIPKGDQGGRRIHSPLCITKVIDRSSPQLEQAMVTGEVLSQVTVRWYRIDEKGHEEHYYTILLEKARITAISLDMETESVSLSYQKITWRWEHPVIETMDLWDEPKG
jgi:type VI secretion system secreted protein Hcp